MGFWGFGAKTETSKVPIMVNKMITDMVETMGPTLFLAKAEKASDKVATVHKARKAMRSANPKRHAKSASGMINKPLEFNTIKSPVPNIHFATKRDKNPNQTVIIRV